MKKAARPSILCAVLLAITAIAEAQQPAKVRRIGYLGLNISSTNPERFDAFRQGLRQLGYTEGKDIIFESRTADGKLDRLNELAAELVRLKVDVIVSRGSTPTRAAKGATATIPIVITQDPDPVGNGFVASLARPGGNITGLSTLAPEISGKQLELLKETIPRLSRVAVLTSSVPGQALQLREIGLAAGPLSVQLQSLDVLGGTRSGSFRTHHAVALLVDHYVRRRYHSFQANILGSTIWSFPVIATCLIRLQLA